MTSEWTLSIDFGTSNTTAAIRDGDRVELVEFGGSPRMPSVVLATESGGLVVGEAAASQLALAPERAERTPKRRIGDEVMLLGSRAFSPVQALAAIFRAVGDEAVRRQGRTPPTQLRLTHPARWGSLRLNALSEAASLADLPRPSFLAEPVAAAVYFADERVPPGDHVAVYDLGGGTFDTAVLRRTDAGFDVVGPPGGDERLGGEVFDERLHDLLGNRLSTTAPDAWEALRFSSERQWRKAGLDFRLEVRRAKEALSANADYTMYLGAPVDVELFITRDEFEALVRADIIATVDELEATISRSGLTPSDLRAIALVGGSSRIPLVTRLVAERFGRVPDTWGDPKAVVVLGAARAAKVVSLASAEPTPGATPRPGRPMPAMIGPYQVLGELGRGGMGVVYLTRQPSLGRLVAVKTLPTLDPSLTVRLEREAAVLAELQHPHIATVLDVGTEEPSTFVAMPYFPGGTLTHVLDHDGRLSASQVAGVLASVAEALAATHARGFLHRDVKPSNILLSAEGDAYLADFGLAFPLLDSARLTNSRSVLGTVAYAAPEVLGDEPPTPAVDVYALGITGYQLLAGQLPYGGSNVLAVLDSVRRGNAPALGDLAPDAPPALADLITAAMHPDAEKRPSDLRAWAADVRRAAAPDPVTPHPPLAWAGLAAGTPAALMSPAGAEVLVSGATVPHSPGSGAMTAGDAGAPVVVANLTTGVSASRNRKLALVGSPLALLLVIALIAAIVMRGSSGDATADLASSPESTTTTAAPVAPVEEEAKPEPAADAGAGEADLGGGGSSGGGGATSSGGGGGGRVPTPTDTTTASPTTTTTSTTTTTTTTTPPPPPPPVDSGSSEPPPPPPPDEYALLLDIIPANIRSTCTKLEDGADSPGEVVEAKCTLISGSSVWYQRYGTTEQARNAWDAYDEGVAYGGAGTEWGCDANTNQFFYEGLYNNDGVDDGMLRCYLKTTTSTAKIHWTDDSHRVFAVTTRANNDWRTLFNAWIGAGPVG